MTTGFTQKDKNLIIKIAKRQDLQKEESDKKFRKTEDDFKFLAQQVVQALALMKQPYKFEKIQAQEFMKPIEEVKNNVVDIKFSEGLPVNDKMQVAAVNAVVKSLQLLCITFGIEKINIKYKEENK